MFALCRMEAYKLWKRPAFYLLLVLLFFTNLGMFYYTQDLQADIPPSYYRALESKLSTMDNEARYDFVNEYDEQIQAFVSLQTIDQIRVSNQDNMEDLIALTLRECPNAEQYREAYQNMQLLFSDQLETEQQFMKLVYQEMQTLHTYPEQLAAIAKKAETLDQISIFQHADTSSTNIKKTAKDYEAMQDVSVVYESEQGIKAAISFPYTTAMLLIMTMAITAFLIQEEKERNLFPMIKSCRHGGIKTILAKLLVMNLSMGFITFCFLVVILIYSGFLFGLGDLLRSLQSLASYIHSTLAINVIQFLFLYIILKWLMMVGVGSMMFLIAFLCKYRFASIGFVVCILALGYGLYTMISPISSLRFLHYLNIYALLQTDVMFQTYLNFQIAGQLLSLLSASLLLLLSIVLGFHVAVILCYHKRHALPSSTFAIALFPQSCSCIPNLLLQEIYKLLVLQKAGIVLILLVLFLYQSDTTTYITQDQRYAMQYMEVLEGPVTKEKDAFIQQETQRFLDVHEDLQKAQIQYQEGNLTKPQYSSVVSQLELQLGNEQVFETIVSQYAYVKEDPHRQLLFTYGYEKLLLQSSQQLLPAILCVLVLLFTCCDCISFEYRNQCHLLLSTTLYGRKRLVKQKLRLAIGCMSIGMALIFGFHLYSYASSYGLPALSASITSLTSYALLPSQLSIFAFLCLHYFICWIACGMVLVIMQACSVQERKPLTALLLGLFCIVLPLCLSLSGIHVLDAISLVPLFTASYQLSMHQETSLLFSLMLYGILASISYHKLMSAYDHR